MVNINSSTWIKNSGDVKTNQTNTASDTDHPIASRAVVSAVSTATKVSFLAKQLSDAATRAAQRESTMSWYELHDTAKSILEKVAGNSYSQNKKFYDSQIPKTDDPALLKLAQQATDFSNDKGSNPFAGMSRDQLALITYDESGSFTTNERFAAWAESASQEYAWRKQFVAKSMDAYHQTGNSNGNGVAQEMLDHFQSLPQMEKVQYPRTYETELQTVAADSANQATSRQGPTDLLSLLNTWEKARQSDGLPKIRSLTETDAPVVQSDQAEISNTAAGSQASDIDPKKMDTPLPTATS